VNGRFWRNLPAGFIPVQSFVVPADPGMAGIPDSSS